MTDKEFYRIFPFDKARPYQREVIEEVIRLYDSGVNHIILQAPTGIGKSVIGLSVAKYLGSGRILTSQKILQDQYVHDYDIPALKGIDNYKCAEYPNVTCKYCTQKKNHELKHHYCPYLMAIKNSEESPISVYNYSIYLSLINGELAYRQLLIMDECHNVENQLVNHNVLEITDKYFDELELSFPSDNCTFNKIIDWINDIYPVLNGAITTCMRKFDSAYIKFDELVKLQDEYDYLMGLVRRIPLISSLARKDQICIYRNEKSIEFKPLYGDQLSSGLLNSCLRTLSMSSTVFSKELYCSSIGLDPDEVAYISLESTFPVMNRLIHYKPVGVMSYSNKSITYPKLANAVRGILSEHSTEKGLIHTANYEITYYLIKELNDSRLVLPRGNTRESELDRFYKSKLPLVLISPSLTEGIDLKDDLSRFTIICKLPYGNLSDEWVIKRKLKSPDWYVTSVLEKLVQMSGRSIRSETDFASTYILDSMFGSVLKSTSKYVPKWWKDSIKWY